MVPSETPILAFASRKELEAWLAKHHAKSPGLWLRLAKKSSGNASVTYAEAVEAALCWGWIDASKQGLDDKAWLQKFVPRGPRSLWSKLNRARAEKLIKSGRMRKPGLAAVAAAKEDGRWKAAYDSPAGASVPPDLAAAFDKDKEAKAFFATVNARNRYAFLWRIQTAKRPETRAKRIAATIAMLRRKEVPHP